MSQETKDFTVLFAQAIRDEEIAQTKPGKVFQEKVENNVSESFVQKEFNHLVGALSEMIKTVSKN
jgi:hypothetical protein